MRDDRELLDDILERISLTDEFVQNDREGFMASRIIQEAVIRNLEIIGEAARNISTELRTQHSEVPWREIIAFRNFVTHVYWGIKMERVWQIIEVDLPALKTQVEIMLRQFDEDD